MTRKTRKLRKGQLYTVWRPPFNSKNGNPTGGIPANKRTKTGRFNDLFFIKPGRLCCIRNELAMGL